MFCGNTSQNNCKKLKKKTSQKAKHQEFKYKNIENNEKDIITSEFDLSDKVEYEIPKKSSEKNKESAFNLAISNISIGEVI